MYKQIQQLVITAVALGVAIPASAQDDQDDNEVADDVDDGTTNCITLRNVRRTEVIDDRNVLYHMRGRTVYLNIMPRQCGGLARQNRFSYSTMMGRLCNLDNITVLYDDPFGLSGGNSCQLGKFHKITREDAKALKEAGSRGPAANPLPMPPPQDIGVDDAEPEEPESESR